MYSQQRGEPQGLRMVGMPAVGGDGEGESIRLGFLLAMLFCCKIELAAT